MLAGHIRDGTLQAGVLSGKACPREGTVGMSHTRVLSGEERGERMLSSPRWFRFSSSGVWRDLQSCSQIPGFRYVFGRNLVAFIIIFLRMIMNLLDGHLGLLEFVLGSQNPPGTSRRWKAHLLGHGPCSQESCCGLSYLQGSARLGLVGVPETQD